MERDQNTASSVNWAIRLSFVGLGLSAFIFYKDFAQHFQAHFTGALLGEVITGQWFIVALNIIAFVAFLVPLSFRRRTDWKEYGLVVAFFVSLFIEMYGIPLTVALASNFLGPAPTTDLHIYFVLPFFWVNFAFTIAMIYGTVLILIGTFWVVVGWVTLYKNVKKDKLVTKGIYSVSRNPQYVGFILVVLGWFVGWPTILTLIFAPILIFVYLRLCVKEQFEVTDLPGYKKYQKRVPLLF